MSARDDGGQAFPCPVSSAGIGDDVLDGGSQGMTLRDWFAGQALTAIIWADGIPYADSPKGQAQHAKMAYGHADAMLQQREKQ